MLEYSKFEQGTTLRQLWKEEKRLPLSVQNAPDLLPGLELYFDAFFDLESERQQSIDLGRIPWFSIQRYGETLRLDSEQMSKLHYCIVAMDLFYVNRAREKSAKEKKAKIEENKQPHKPFRPKH